MTEYEAIAIAKQYLTNNGIDYLDVDSTKQLPATVYGSDKRGRSDCWIIYFTTMEPDNDDGEVITGQDLLIVTVDMNTRETTLHCSL